MGTLTPKLTYLTSRCSSWCHLSLILSFFTVTSEWKSCQSLTSALQCQYPISTAIDLTTHCIPVWKLQQSVPVYRCLHGPWYVCILPTGAVLVLGENDQHTVHFAMLSFCEPVSFHVDYRLGGISKMVTIETFNKIFDFSDFFFFLMPGKGR